VRQRLMRLKGGGFGHDFEDADESVQRLPRTTNMACRCSGVM
jgi:hypothetical protein